jgi:hypothetical protein
MLKILNCNIVLLSVYRIQRYYEAIIGTKGFLPYYYYSPLQTIKYTHTHTHHYKITSSYTKISQEGHRFLTFAPMAQDKENMETYITLAIHICVV